MQPSVQNGLEAWLAAAGFPECEPLPLPGDVSPRRYTRLVGPDGGSAILAIYPPEIRGTCTRFLRTTALLEPAGVPVPRVLASSCDEGWMLVEDLGPETLAEWGRDRPWSELQPYFERAVELADRIGRIPVESVEGLNPRLGGELLRKELAQTWDLFLQPRGLTTPGLGAVLDALCANLDAETPISCHRDFMVRNLMPVSDGLVVLDHQDLRLGPPAYDLASLLNDTLFPPREMEEALFARASFDRLSYHRAAAQRTLKAIGTYASFALRGADRHLPLVPRTLGRCLAHLAQVPESAPLVSDLADVWAPVLKAWEA
ncbi:MAG: N-acetylmuramate 1-kinase [Acidobacteriota bacterium]|jgi:aminoglycoside/choline kinase family phosphotransferase|nr:N-acetylmuramate 1-kinase [Acidobacteriota bacterium]